MNGLSNSIPVQANALPAASQLCRNNSICACRLFASTITFLTVNCQIPDGLDLIYGWRAYHPDLQWVSVDLHGRDNVSKTLSADHKDKYSPAEASGRAALAIERTVGTGVPAFTSAAVSVERGNVCCKTSA